MTEEYVLEDIIQKLKEVEESGFGEVIIKVQNHAVHSTLTTKHQLVYNKKQEVTYGKQ